MRDRDPAGSGTSGSCSRRRFLSTAGTAVVATCLAGCSRVTDYEFSAKPVVLSDDARANLGYETLHREPVVEERSRTIGGVDVNVTVENHVTVYGAIDGDERGTAAAPVIGAASTPEASVMGRSFNPLARLSLANLLTSEGGSEFLRRAGANEIGHSRSRIRWERGPRFVAGREGTCLDARTTLESYAGILGGGPRSVAFVHLTRVEADSVVIVAAVHGHDVEEPDRPFVGPDSGYLSPGVFDDAVGIFADASTAFRYGGGRR